MIKNKHWFTFVEILISIAILSIISVFAISNFWKNFEKQNLQEELDYFKYNLENLENSLWKETTDYEVYLSLGWEYYYTTNKNYSINNQSILQLNSFTWKITTSNQWDIAYIYKNNMFIQTISWSQIFEIDISQKGNYKIDTFNSWKKINPLYIQRYANIEKIKNIELIDIENNSYTGIIIKNSLWQKRQILSSNNETITQDINLTFEDEKWNQTTLVLSNK